MSDASDKIEKGQLPGLSSAHIFTVGSLLSVFLFSGVCLQVLPASAPTIIDSWHIPALSLALPLSLNALGTGLGTIFGGMIGDVVGRRLPIILATLLQGLAVLLGAFAHDPMVLAISMLCVGLGYGGSNSAGLALITELVPPRQGGLMVGLAMTAGPFGLGLGSFAAAFLVPHYGWPSLFFAAAAVAVPILLALIFNLPESPSFLTRGAKKSPAPHASNSKQRDWQSLPLLSLLSKDNLFLTLALWFLAITICLMGTALLSWIPVILATQQFPKEFASGSLSLWTLGAMGGTLVSGTVISRIGLRRATPLCSIASIFGMTVLALVPLRPSTGIWLVAALLLVGGFAVAGIVTSLYTQAAESYPAEMRATGIGMTDGIGRVGSILAPYCGIYIVDQAGAHGFFAFEAALSLLVLVIFVLLGRHRPKQMSLSPAV